MSPPKYGADFALVSAGQ